jgi:hypothetical protein
MIILMLWFAVLLWCLQNPGKYRGPFGTWGRPVYGTPREQGIRMLAVFGGFVVALALLYVANTLGIGWL